MKKILLLGDSIRKGYDKYVQAALGGKAEVYFPTDNCRFALYLLRQLHVWKKELSLPDDIDLVHWNAGLWDTLTLFGDGTLSSPEQYADSIKRIDKRLRILFPKARIVFATSTPVLEHKFRHPESSIRYNKDIEDFNEIAKTALADTDAIINDLYATVQGVPESYYSDMTHLYTKEGTELIGNRVLQVICEILDLCCDTSAASGIDFSDPNVIGI